MILVISLFVGKINMSFAGEKTACHAIHQPWSCKFSWFLAEGYRNGDQCREDGCATLYLLIIIVMCIFLVVMCYHRLQSS